MFLSKGKLVNNWAGLSDTVYVGFLRNSTYFFVTVQPEAEHECTMSLRFLVIIL
jgi:hypothetical protein